MTVTAGFGSASEDRRLAGSAAYPAVVGSVLVLAAMPVAMALANRSAPLFLGLAAVLALISTAAALGWRGLWRVLVSGLTSPFGLAGAAFVLLALLSYGWSVDRAQSLRALSEAAVPLIAGAAIFLLLPRVAPSWTVRALALGAIAGALICIVELKFNMPFRTAMHLRVKAFEYNRPVLTLLALFWPLLAAALGSRRDLLLWLALALTVVAIWVSYSGTAMMAQAVSAAAVLVAWRFPRAALWTAAIAVAVVFASIFAFGDLAWRLLPDSIYRLLDWTHAADRVEIWRSFGAAMLLHPWLGAGFGTSVTLGDTAIAGQVAPELQRMLSVGHPHNGYLQVGVELGLVGCVLALAMLLALLRSWNSLTGRPLYARLGLFTMAAATMLVGHGAWQAWWIAVLFAGGAAARILARASAPQPDGSVT